MKIVIVFLLSNKTYIGHPFEKLVNNIVTYQNKVLSNIHFPDGHALSKITLPPRSLLGLRTIGLCENVYQLKSKTLINVVPVSLTFVIVSCYLAINHYLI